MGFSCLDSNLNSHFVRFATRKDPPAPVPLWSYMDYGIKLHHRTVRSIQALKKLNDILLMEDILHHLQFKKKQR